MAYPLPRRSVQAVITRYRLEPTVRDFFVEGAFDVRILRDVFTRNGKPNASIFVVDSVDVTDSILAKYGLTRGEKNEIIALSLEIDAAVGNIPGFTCVVDADCERSIGQTATPQSIFRTDFTCMEMYWITQSSISIFFRWLAKGGDDSAMLRDIGVAAKSLFLIRATLQALYIGARMIPMRKYCVSTGETIDFDSMSYLQSVLLAAGMGIRLDDCRQKMRELEQASLGDPRHYMNGHDVIELVCIAYKSDLRRIGIRDETGLINVILLMLSYEDMSKFPLFASLLQRCA